MRQLRCLHVLVCGLGMQGGVWTGKLETYIHVLSGLRVHIRMSLPRSGEMKLSLDTHTHTHTHTRVYI